MSEYTYTDPYDYDLTIRRSTAAKGDVAIEARVPVDVPAVDLPEIVAELYKAAGQEPPVVHEHVDDEAQALSIVSSECRPNVAFVEGCNGAYVTPEDLPGLVRKLYEAAGQESPILLPRLEWHGNDRKAFVFNGVSAVRTGKTINILGRIWDATTARGVARMLTELAEAADEEPDPGQLAALAEVVRELAAKDVQMYDDGGEAVARAVLAAGYTRSES